jgi:hypothetical protein
MVNAHIGRAVKKVGIPQTDRSPPMHENATNHAVDEFRTVIFHD